MQYKCHCVLTLHLPLNVNRVKRLLCLRFPNTGSTVPMLQRCERDGARVEPRGDQRPARKQMPANQFSEAERARLMRVVNSTEFALHSRSSVH